MYQFSQFSFRYFGSRNQLSQIYTATNGILNGTCWVIKEETKFIHGFCNVLSSEDFVLGKLVLTGKLQDSINKWIIGNPVSLHKLEKGRFITHIEFKEDENW
jgi:hypothetical protein